MIRKAILFSLLTTIISGFSIFANGLFVTKSDPVIFAFLRNAIVAIILSVIFILKHYYSSSPVERLPHDRKDWYKLFLIGAIGGGIPFALFFSGLSMIGAGNGAIIQKSLFLWVALLAVPFLQETIGWLTILGYVTIFGAIFFLGGKFSFVPNIGSLMVLAATILWAVEQIIAKKTLKHVSPVLVSWGRMIFGLPFLLAAVLLTGKASISIYPTIVHSMTPLLISSVLLSAYMISWYNALKRAPATLVSAVLVLSPAMTIALQSGIMGKPLPTVMQLGSLVAAAMGVFFVMIPYIQRHKKI